MNEDILQKFLALKHRGHKTSCHSVPRQPLSPPKISRTRLKMFRNISPTYWHAEEIEVKRVKHRSRIEDFHNDFVGHLFPNKSPTFHKKADPALPKLEGKHFFRKRDKIASYRSEMIKMRKQGFFSSKSRLDLQ